MFNYTCKCEALLQLLVVYIAEYSENLTKMFKVLGWISQLRLEANSVFRKYISFQSWMLKSTVGQTNAANLQNFNFIVCRECRCLYLLFVDLCLHFEMKSLYR